MGSILQISTQILRFHTVDIYINTQVPYCIDIYTNKWVLYCRYLHKYGIWNPFPYCRYWISTQIHGFHTVDTRYLHKYIGSILQISTQIHGFHTVDIYTNTQVPYCRYLHKYMVPYCRYLHKYIGSILQISTQIHRFHTVDIYTNTWFHTVDITTNTQVPYCRYFAQIHGFYTVQIDGFQTAAVDIYRFKFIHKNIQLKTKDIHNSKKFQIMNFIVNLLQYSIFKLLLFGV